MKKVKSFLATMGILLPLFFVACFTDEAGTNPESSKPRADIDAPFRAFLNDSLTVRALASDDGPIEGYWWKFGSSRWYFSQYPDTQIWTPSTPQPYVCSLKVVDNDGLIGYASKTIMVEGFAPTIQLSQRSVSVGVNETVHLSATATDNIDGGNVIDFEWKFGLNTWRSVKRFAIDTSTNDTSLYTDTIITVPSTAQTYLCSLRVTDDDGMQSFGQVQIYVINKQFSVSVDADPTLALINTPVTLKGYISSGGELSSSFKWEWKIGSLPWNPAQKDTTIIPKAAGTLVCSLQVTNSFGSVSKAAVKIQVKASDLIADAAADPKIVFINNPVRLIGNALSSNSEAQVVEWAWRIGQKPWRVSQKDTVFIPDEAGTVVCSLRVMNSFGTISKSSVSVLVKSTDLTAIAVADPKIVFINNPVRLIGNAVSSNSEAQVVEWAWKIGQKPWRVSQKDTVFIPEEAGSVVCSLRVMNSYGIISKSSVSVQVKSTDLTAIADANPQAVFVNSPVNLYGKAVSTNGDAQVIEWAWRIGQKPWRVSQKDTVFIPEEVGTVVCSLRVTDQTNTIAKASISIVVRPTNLQAIAGNNLTVGLNDRVVLNGQGYPEDQILLYRWKINNYPWRDGGKDTTIISAPTEQLWPCSLEVIDKYGQSAKDGFSIFSKSKPPMARAVATPAVVAINGLITLKGEGIDEEGILRYEWKFGDYPWREASKDTVIRGPLTAQVYRCSLKVVDMDFEEGKTSVDIRITNNPVIAYAGEDTIVGTEEMFKLNGQELSGVQVQEWWWKIDRYGIWRRTSRADTLIQTSYTPTTLVCSLKVVTINNAEGFDEIILYVKSGTNNKVVYTKANSDRIYTNNLTFNSEEAMTLNGEDPKWSPDGMRIAYTRRVSNQYYIHVADWNGLNVRQLSSTIGGRHPSWYPDNRTIAYERENNSTRTVYTVDIESNSSRQLFNIENRQLEEPFVNSTNQAEIAYLYTVTNARTDFDQVWVYSNAGNIKIKGTSNDNRWTRGNLSVYGDRFLWNARYSSDKNNYLQVISRSDTTTIVDIETSQNDDLLRGIFARDGASIYYVRVNNGSNVSTLYRYDFSSGLRYTLASVSGKIQNFDIK